MSAVKDFLLVMSPCCGVLLEDGSLSPVLTGDALVPLKMVEAGAKLS